MVALESWNSPFGGPDNQSCKIKLVELLLDTEFVPTETGLMGARDGPMPSCFRWINTSPGQSRFSLPLASSSQVTERISSAIIFMPVEFFQVFSGISLIYAIPCQAFALGVEEDQVMHWPPSLRAIVRTGSLPDNLVFEELRPKDRVHQNFK
jgi:hypothetical protein